MYHDETRSNARVIWYAIALSGTWTEESGWTCDAKFAIFAERPHTCTSYVCESTSVGVSEVLKLSHDAHVAIQNSLTRHQGFSCIPSW